MSNRRILFFSGLVLLIIFHPVEILANQGSRLVQVFAAATNAELWPNPDAAPAIQLSGSSSVSDAPVQISLAPRSFSGLNGNNQAQTMTFSGAGFGSSRFGMLKVSVQGQVNNTFYNQNNLSFYRPPDVFEPNGVPDRMSFIAVALFTNEINDQQTLRASEPVTGKARERRHSQFYFKRAERCR